MSRKQNVLENSASRWALFLGRKSKVKIPAKTKTGKPTKKTVIVVRPSRRVSAFLPKVQCLDVIYALIRYKEAEKGK